MLRQSDISAEMRYISAAFQLQARRPKISAQASQPRSRRTNGYCGIAMSGVRPGAMRAAVSVMMQVEGGNLHGCRPSIPSVCRRAGGVCGKACNHLLQLCLIAGFVRFDEQLDLFLEGALVRFVGLGLIFLDVSLQ